MTDTAVKAVSGRRVAALPVEPDDGFGFSRGDMLWLPEQLDTVTRFCFTIPHKPPLLNDLNQLRAIDATRQGGRGGYNDYKSAWARIIRHYWVMTSRQANCRPWRIVGPYRAEYLYICADRRADPSNMHAASEKFVLDALVEVGALPGDGFKWHEAGSTYSAQHAPGTWGIFVTLEQVAEPATTDKRKAVGRHRTRRAKKLKK